MLVQQSGDRSTVAAIDKESNLILIQTDDWDQVGTHHLVIRDCSADFSSTNEIQVFVTVLANYPPEPVTELEASFSVDPGV